MAIDFKVTVWLSFCFYFILTFYRFSISISSINSITFSNPNLISSMNSIIYFNLNIFSKFYYFSILLGTFLPFSISISSLNSYYFNHHLFKNLTYKLQSPENVLELFENRIMKHNVIVGTIITVFLPHLNDYLQVKICI